MDKELDEIFTLEKFKNLLVDNPFPNALDKLIASRAKQILKEYAEKNWPMVFGINDGEFHAHSKVNGNYNPQFKARLAFVTEIKKSKCEHKPLFINHANLTKKIELLCVKCGVELEVPETWREVE